MNITLIRTLLVFLVLTSIGCKKEQTVFEDNDAPPYDEIATIRVQNYVNRVFIDLIGREPVDLEMDAEVLTLEAAGLSFESREILIEKLQFSTTFVEGDSSYNHAYYHKIYEDCKARMLEGASEGYIGKQYGLAFFQAIADSINGNLAGYQQNMITANRLKAVMDSKEEYRLNEITIDEMYRRMMRNNVYDAINMNTFNFVNATFDDLYFRFPTTAEFENAFVIIENNQPAEIFGAVAQNKDEYLAILTSNSEYEEGMVNWAFLSLLAREPTTAEAFNLTSGFHLGYNIQEVQKQIMITDEYAGFD